MNVSVPVTIFLSFVFNHFVFVQSRQNAKHITFLTQIRMMRHFPMNLKEFSTILPDILVFHDLPGPWEP